MEVVTKEEFKKFEARFEDLNKEVKQLRSLPPYPEWVTLKQATEMLNRCSSVVSKMAKEGKLEYKKGKRKVEILSESIRQYNLKQTILQ